MRALTGPSALRYVFGKLPVANSKPLLCPGVPWCCGLGGTEVQITFQGLEPTGDFSMGPSGCAEHPCLPQRRAMHRPYREQPQCGVSIPYTVRAAGNARLTLSEFRKLERSKASIVDSRHLSCETRQLAARSFKRVQKGLTVPISRADFPKNTGLHFNTVA